jgi:hypothetical protein
MVVLLLLDDIAVDVVGMIMVMRIDGKVVGDLATEEFQVGRMP